MTFWCLARCFSIYSDYLKRLDYTNSLHYYETCSFISLWEVSIEQFWRTWHINREHNHLRNTRSRSILKLHTLLCLSSLIFFFSWFSRLYTSWIHRYFLNFSSKSCSFHFTSQIFFLNPLACFTALLHWSLACSHNECRNMNLGCKNGYHCASDGNCVCNNDRCSSAQSCGHLTCQTGKSASCHAHFKQCYCATHDQHKTTSPTGNCLQIDLLHQNLI